ncbi:hypothetical protein LK09_17005 [Microbacterium mangrovi]|uniref:Uncharacterized protein n=1 Tax=Microbacterium mangrovi TaxID=1348253 RepID=A0A0B2A393_9MICO|nr:hypothetical protein [Microbacterium mangrovi]KHK96048.1 hypothetical protein LK09_17005 [Microbacterium mangrovi]
MLTALIGLVAGIIVGTLATAVAVASTFALAVDRQVAVSFPLLIRVDVSGDAITASSGGGLFAPTLVAGLAGVVIALAIRIARRRGHPARP